MATKKERDALLALQGEIALSWPRYPEPVALTPDQLRDMADNSERVPAGSTWGGDGTRRGAAVWFATVPADNPLSAVYHGYSDGCGHSHSAGSVTWVQGWGHAFPTKLDALRAYRWGKSREYGKKLAQIDQMILDERARLAAEREDTP